MDPLTILGLISAGGGLLGSAFGSNKPKELQRFSPEVQNKLMELFGSASSGSPSGFAPIESRAREQFQTQTVPGLAERFTAMGGGQRSSAFQGALGSAGSDLESQLAMLKSQYGQQQLQQLLPFLEKEYQSNQPGFGQQAAQGLFSGGMSMLNYSLLNNMMNPSSGKSSTNNNQGSIFNQPFMKNITSGYNSNNGLGFNQNNSGRINLLGGGNV